MPDDELASNTTTACCGSSSTAVDLEVEAAVGVIGSADAQEGLAAFLGKREPVFAATI